MKTTKYILLFIGLAGLSATVFGLARGEAFTDHLMTIICSVSLIYGYASLSKVNSDIATECAKD